MTTLFTKRSSRTGSIAAEVKGLKLLAATLEQGNVTEVRVPHIEAYSEDSLSMRHIDSRSATTEQMWQLGCGLAKLHRLPASQYGYVENNFIGLSPQFNVFSDNWGEFFMDFRLMPQVELVQNSRLKAVFSDTLAQVRVNLVHWLNRNIVRPCLVHGDLWSGNVMFDSSNIWLIDPACYYGDGEVDIAMTEMFGGFTSEFYQGYQSINPLTEQYALKRIVYNLYHYLNHFNLFGDAYLRDCEQGFARLKSDFKG